jgi:hypothetical protein
MRSLWRESTPHRQTHLFRLRGGPGRGAVRAPARPACRGYARHPPAATARAHGRTRAAVYFMPYMRTCIVGRYLGLGRLSVSKLRVGPDQPDPPPAATRHASCPLSAAPRSHADRPGVSQGGARHGQADGARKGLHCGGRGGRQTRMTVSRNLRTINPSIRWRTCYGTRTGKLIRAGESRKVRR